MAPNAGLPSVPALLIAIGLLLQQAVVFRTTTIVVPVHATVVGSDGRLLSHLQRGDFTVYEGAEVRPIASFSAEGGPLAVVAMWDGSAALKRNRPQSLQSAYALVAALWKDDRAQFGAFDSHEVFVNPTVTSDQSTLRRIIDEEFWLSSGPLHIPLWRAISSAVEQVSKREGRRAVVILTAGKATDETELSREVVRRIHASNVLLYAVGLKSSGLTRQIRQLAVDSGGGYADLSDDADLPSEFGRIVSELHHQYTLGVIPEDEGGELRSLEVRVKVPGATVRARRVYVAGEIR